MLAKGNQMAYFSQISLTLPSMWPNKTLVPTCKGEAPLHAAQRGLSPSVLAEWSSRSTIIEWHITFPRGIR